MTHEFGADSFDMVASVAVLHHFDDPAAALRRMAALVAPGGSLVVVGLARNSRLRDLAWDAVGFVKHRRRLHTRTLWEHSAPTVWPPVQTFSEARSMARDILPGARYRRLALWRYAIIWRNEPADALAVPE